MTCPACHTELPDDTLICPECGLDLDPEPLAARATLGDLRNAYPALALVAEQHFGIER